MQTLPEVRNSALPNAELKAEIGLFNRNNPFSVYNIIDRKMLEKELDSAQTMMDITSREELEKDLREESTKEQRMLLNYLRSAFWYEYDCAVGSKRKMAMSRVYEGHCGFSRFKTTIKNPLFFSYILFRPKADEVKLEAITNRAYERLMEVMDMDLIDFKGRPNIGLIKEVHSIWKSFDQRKNGGVVQKIHSTSLNVDAKKSDLLDYNNMTDEELDKLLANQHNKNNQTQLVVDGTSTNVQTIEVEATPSSTGKEA